MPVLKMLSRRKPSAIAHTLRYVTREGANGEVPPILYNLRSSPDDLEAVAQEFLINEAYRKVTSNRLYSYHTILSLSNLDKEKATPNVMQAIVTKYLELRGNILAYAVPHFDTDSAHWHICESSTFYRENRATGMRKKELHQLKMELEAFVKEQFPEMEHSQVDHGKGKAYLREPEYQLQKRTGTSERKHLKTLIRNTYRSATSKQQFLDTLLDHGYIHYERTDGVLTGVVSESGRKYRFKTLGISPEQIIALENAQERFQEKSLLEQLKNLRQNTNPKNLER